MHVLNDSQTDLLFRKLALLHQGCQELEQIAYLYDYSPQLPGNGFRSFISLCSIFKQKVQRSLPISKQMLTDYNTAASTLLKVQNVLMDVRCKGPDVDYTVITEDDVRIMGHVNTFSPSCIVPFFDTKSLGLFWLRDFAAKENLDRQMMTEILTTGSWWKRVKLWFSSRFRAECAAVTSITSSVQKMRDMSTMFTTFPLTFLLGLSTRGSGVDKRDVWVPRNNPFVIKVKDTKTPASIHKSSTRRQGNDIRCMLLAPKHKLLPQHDGKSLMLHIHGGAFMLGSPEMFFKILSKPCLDLNVPVLSVDFGLAPDHKYPSGMQDVLDVYLWLVSGSHDVERMLGFRPTKIVLMGESSGANMAIELCFALTMIQDLGHNFLMPKGLSIQYPCIVAAPIASPAGAFLAIDPCVTSGLVAVSIAAYPELDPPAPDDWHRDSQKARQVMDSMRHRLKDPLFNVMAGDYLSRLRDVKLSLLLCEFDPLLDQGIAIAKKWPSEPRIMLAKGMPHGLTMSHIEKAPEEFDWISEGIREILVE